MAVNHGDVGNDDHHLRGLSVYKVGGSTQPLEGENFKFDPYSIKFWELVLLCFTLGREN